MFKKIIASLVLALFSVALYMPTMSQAKLADGIYSIPYQVNNNGKDVPSVGNDYFVKPAKLTVENGKMVAEMTVKNASWIVKLEAPNYKELRVDTANDTRLFQFEVADLSAKTAVSMRVEIPHLDYYHSYTVDFVFDEAKATKTGNVASQQAVVSRTPVAATTAVNSASAGVAAQQAADHKAAENASTTKVITSPKTTTSNTTTTKPATSTTAKTTTTSQVKNPQTSDELPYIALALLCVSAFLIIRLRKQTV